MAYLPFTPDTWKRVARLLNADESQYWSKTNANPYETEEGLEQAIDCLVRHGRPYAAIRCLEALRHHKRPLDSRQAIRALQATLHCSEGAHARDAHAIVEVIKALQDDPNTNPDDLFKVEWAFLPLLDQHHDASPKLLEQRLADDPAFFCTVIRIVFRSKKEEPCVEEPTENQKEIVTNAYRLLSNWKTPPGKRKDGTFNGDALTSWLEAVKTACLESGHLDIAHSMVGQVLIHTPPDPDGLWLHREAAIALNAKDGDRMREGFKSALYDSRGVHWVDPEGQEERKLAEKYRKQAEEVEAQGYHRLAGSLRQLGASYEREAEREALRNSFDDD